MDVSDAIYYIFNEQKKRIKVAKWGTPKNILKNNISAFTKIKTKFQAYFQIVPLIIIKMWVKSYILFL